MKTDPKTQYQLPSSLGPGERIQIYFPAALYDLLLEKHRKGREPNWKTIARNALQGALQDAA